MRPEIVPCRQRPVHPATLNMETPPAARQRLGPRRKQAHCLRVLCIAWLRRPGPTTDRNRQPEKVGRSVESGSSRKSSKATDHLILTPCATGPPAPKPGKTRKRHSERGGVGRGTTRPLAAQRVARHPAPNAPRGADRTSAAREAGRLQEEERARNSAATKPVQGRRRRFSIGVHGTCDQSIYCARSGLADWRISKSRGHHAPKGLNPIAQGRAAHPGHGRHDTAFYPNGVSSGGRPRCRPGKRCNPFRVNDCARFLTLRVRCATLGYQMQP